MKFICTHIYIYIYRERERERGEYTSAATADKVEEYGATENINVTDIVDFC